MVLNGLHLFLAQPIKGMIPAKERAHGVSHGLTEAGYDIRIKQEVIFLPGDHSDPEDPDVVVVDGMADYGLFTIASAVEEFQMPANLVGVVHDKSTWARLGLSVQNTVIEPGWNGFLTLELSYRGQGELRIPAGAGIAQVLFHQLADRASYDGKYQNQPDKPVEAIHA